MEYNFELLDLLNRKEFCIKELDSTPYGSVEVRDNYIYTHYKIDDKAYTKYIGEYTEDAYNETINNNIKAKKLKKEIRNINKKLDGFGYREITLSDEVKTNIDFARRNLANTIYKQAILEGVNTTLVKTENIIEGLIVNNMTPSDVLKIINLKHAWDFILDKYVITFKTDYNILCSINKLVVEGFYYNAGKLRSVPVSITGTTWTPDYPIEADIKDDINRILNRRINDVDKAIELLLYVTKKQMFIDGNKRTSIIFANHYLISKAKGLIVIPDNKVEEYKKLLIEYYETNNKEKIKEFIKKNHIYL